MPVPLLHRTRIRLLAIGLAGVICCGLVVPSSRNGAELWSGGHVILAQEQPANAPETPAGTVEKPLELPGKKALAGRANDPLQREIEAAVKRGLAFLKGPMQGQRDGYAWLSAAALLKAGIPADDPAVATVIQDVVSHSDGGVFKSPNSQHHIYEAGVGIVVLSAANAQKYRNNIAAIANYIISQQGPAGDWDYPTRSTGDTSISQYAVLGLWEAARVGVNVPRAVWNNAASWFIKKQLVDGSFTYHPSGASDIGTHTMTVAGIGSLYICRMFLYPSSGTAISVDTTANKSRKKSVYRAGRKYGVLDPAGGDIVVPGEGSKTVADAPTVAKTLEGVSQTAIDAAIRKGFGWLDPKFSIDPPATAWKNYYLYGIERLAAFSDRRTIGGTDWYEEGARHLLKTQGPAGEWRQDSAGTEAGTAFSILFLVRSTAKALNRPLAARGLGGGLLIGGRGLPENLAEVTVQNGEVHVRKSTGDVDDLLGQLDNPLLANETDASTKLVEAITEKPEELIGKLDRLLELAKSRSADVRQTAIWALGRSRDLRGAKALITALADTDESVVLEARIALRYLSQRRITDFTPGEPCLPAMTEQERDDWKAWFLQSRPYDERDDFLEPIR